MKHLKLFFACLLMAVLSIGQVWGAIDANSTWTATAFADIPDGATVVIINNFGNSFANATVTKAPAKVAASFNSTTKKITVSTTGKSLDDIAWTVEQATNGTKFWVYGSTTNILGLSKTNDNNAVAVNTTSNAQYNEFVMGNNGKLLKYYNAGRYVGEYVSGSDWRSYNAENATNYKSGGTEQALTFYVLDAAPTEPFTVTLMDNSATLTEESAGAGVTLPSRDGCEGYTFAGWTNTWTAAQSSWTETAPEIISAGTYHPSADENLYPVYTKVESSSSSGFTGYTQIALGGTITDGQYLISTGSFTMAGSGKTGASFTPGSTEKTEYEYTISVDGDYFTILGPDNKYVGSGSGTGLIFDNSASEDTYKWEYVSTGILNKSNTTRHIKGYNTTDFRNYTTSNGTLTYLYKRTEGGSSSTTYYISEPSCCTKRAISIATGITNGSISADLAEACEGVTVTITFSPAGGYHLDSWSVNGTAQEVAANTFMMPATAATVSASFVHDDCTNLSAPTLDEITKSYNSATIAWNTVTDAVAYAVSVVKDGESEPVFSGNVTELSKALENLEPETQYNYTIMAVGDGTVKCADGNGVLEGNFTTESLPTAHLTLIDPSGTHASSGDYAILTPFNLPSTAAACSKSFRGWDSNENCTTTPTYAKGAEFTFANTTSVTLYAVYADELTPGTTSYVKTALADIASGSEVVVTEKKGDDMWALSYNPSTSKTVAAAVSEDENILDVTSLTNGFWTLSKDGDNFTLTVVGGTDKLYCNNSNDGVRVGSGAANAFSINSNYLYTSATSDARYLGVYSGTEFRCYTSINTNISGQTLAFYKKVTSEGTYGNYSTTCVAAPTATPASNPLEVSAAGVNDATLGVTYDNVNPAGVSVALCSDNQGAAFTGDWLTATIAGEDKHIEYTVQANTSYNDARTAYIQLTAPETSGAASPAVVYIEVTQAKKPAVFASLAELVAAEIPSGEEVTVTFDEVITGFYTNSQSKKKGIYLTTKAANDKAIEIYYNQGDEVVPSTWVAGGKASATAKVYTWTYYTGGTQWELVPNGTDRTWTGDDFVTYTAPKAVSSVVVSGTPDKTTYVDGEKFDPAGLTVTVYYNDETNEVDPVGVTFACTPERVTKETTSVSVVATFNEVPSDAFAVTGFTVGDIQTKTVAQFIEAGNADMRCYLEGIVSDIETGTKLKYGNFNLTDASGTIYVYGCLTSEGVAEKFDELGVANGDKIKVIAEDYDYYNSKHEAKNVVFVSKTPAATISIDDINMEVGDEIVLSSIAATITPEVAESATINYEVTAGAAVTISEGKIIAEAAGEATITASIAEGVGYLAGNTTFTVTVTAPDTRKIATASAFTALSGDMSSTDISFAAYQGDATNAPVVRSGDNPVTIRMYKAASGKSTGGYLTLTAKVGCTIDQVQITFSGNADAAYCMDDEALPTEKYITSKTVLLTPADLNAQSVSIVNLKNGSIDVNAIKVWYNGEPLAIDHYFVDATGATTEFVQYSTFDYTGLKVYAAYDELETITEEISGFTATADLMTAGDKKAKVYLNEVEIAEYDITVTASSKQNPALAYDPTSDEITLGDAWTAPTLDNPLNVEGISYTSSNTSVAKVTSAGIITLQGGCGEATITASFAETEAYVASSATYTITVNEPAEVLGGKWELVNEVLPGMRIIIANEASAGAIKTMGGQNSNNRAAVASTVDGEGVLTPAAGTKTFLVVATETEGQYALQARNGKYIYAASNSSNNMKEQNNIDGNAKWSFSFSENVATITANGSNSHNVIRYNSQSNIFSCYADGQSDVYVYAWKPYSRTVSGNYGTICLPKAGVLTNGVLYEISYYDADQKKIFFDEVEGGVMVAGAPYIFKPNENVTELKVAYTDVAVVDNAGHKNGLYGHYDLNNPTEGAEAARLFLTNGDYFLRNNEYWLVDQEDRVYVDNYRAYIKLDKIGNDVPPQAYGRRRVAMNVNGEQVATGFENLNASEKPVKLMIDGNIYILRGEKLYDATGRLVK